MSQTPTLLTARHFDYLRERTLADDDLLLSLKRAAKTSGLPEISIAPEQASLIQILLRAIGAREVIEIGTLGGYSAIRMARALPENGRVRTIEVSDHHARFARQWIARSDVANRVEVHLGRGIDVLPGFASDSADAAFLDADKESYPAYLCECLRIVRPGGLILVDNAFAFGRLFDTGAVDADVAAVRAFNDLMARTPGLHAAIVPLGDGMWVAVRK